MAAFSYYQLQHTNPFVVDSLFLPNSPIKMLEEPYNCYYQPEMANVTVQESSHCFDQKHHTNSGSILDMDSSSVTDKITDKKRKDREGSNSSTSSANSTKNVREGDDGKKKKGQVEKKEKKKKNKKGNDETPGFIHVRARRGQATDSHSLAERVRREKISERMKILQSLVPGCDKVTGKALMLDEIINYVQSLQNQVEFLSMKLASSNPMYYDFGMDLDALMVTPEQQNLMSGLGTPLPVMQQACSPTNTTSQPYPFLDTSASSLVFQHPNSISQGDGQLLWAGEDQRQKFIEFSNNFCSFH